MRAIASFMTAIIRPPRSVRQHFDDVAGTKQLLAFRQHDQHVRIGGGAQPMRAVGGIRRNLQDAVDRRQAGGRAGIRVARCACRNPRPCGHASAGAAPRLPCRPSSSARPSVSQVASTETGLPGKPRNCARSSAPNSSGMPGFMRTFQKWTRPCSCSNRWNVILLACRHRAAGDHDIETRRRVAQRRAQAAPGRPASVGQAVGSRPSRTQQAHQQFAVACRRSRPGCNGMPGSTSSSPVVNTATVGRCATVDLSHVRAKRPARRGRRQRIARPKHPVAGTHVFAGIANMRTLARRSCLRSGPVRLRRAALPGSRPCRRPAAAVRRW